MITKYTEFMNDNNWEWRYQMITKYTEFMEIDIKWLLNIQNLWIDNNWEWRYQMITKYTEFMNR